AAGVGLLLFYAGVKTHLMGSYGDLESSEWYARAQAGFFHPNLLASFSIFASAIIARPTAGLSRGFRRAALVALWLTVFLTFSRGILAFLLAAAIRSPRVNRSRTLVYTLAAVTLAVMAMLSIWNLKVNPATPLSIQFDNQPSSRREAATSSLKTLTAHPLTGSGPGTHPGSYRGGPFDAHSTPINIAATYGLPALIAFTSLVVILWRGRNRPTDLALWGGFVGLILDGLAQDTEDFRHLWVMFGLADRDSIDTSSQQMK
ncbi:MAG TPA: O-antigen ligase family protein, partial [Blastocatellia bacterium]|nr:O-antigen ligase family protein [Blastocatellia bacterium]